MAESLVDIFCPRGESIRKVGGGRRIIGVTDTDAAALGMFDTRIGSGEQTWIYANVSWNELLGIADGHVFSSGGAPNIYSMLAQYPAITMAMRENPDNVYPFTLEDMVKAIQEQPENPPVRWIYHSPVLEVLQANAAKLEGLAKLEDYLKMRFLPDVTNIGQTDAYKQKGIAVPQWVLEATAVIPGEKQKPLRLNAQDAPFVEGWDPFLILAGVNFANPNYNMMVFVGGRTPSTFAAELMAIGKDSISREEIEAAKSQTELFGVKLLISFIQVPEATHYIKGIKPFLEETASELTANLSSRYGQEFRGNYLNVAIVGMAHIRSGLPVRVSGPLDIRFYNRI